MSMKRLPESVRDPKRTNLLAEPPDLASSPDPMWFFDSHTFAFLDVNDAAIRRYGYSRQEFLSMTILDIRPIEDIVPLLREELRDGRYNSDRELWRHRKKNGEVIEVEITSREVIFGGAVAEIVIVRDPDQTWKNYSRRV
jgi:PAS domain S-box-containing protein